MPFDPSSPAMFGQTISRRSLLRGTAAPRRTGDRRQPRCASVCWGSGRRRGLVHATVGVPDRLHARSGSRRTVPDSSEKRDAELDVSLAALTQLIKQSGVSNMDGFLALTGTDPALTKTATKIVSAWYLGVVGEPEDAELITYAESLMYRPTKGLLTVPSYGPGPNAWGPKPGSKI